MNLKFLLIRIFFLFGLLLYFQFAVLGKLFEVFTNHHFFLYTPYIVLIQPIYMRVPQFFQMLLRLQYVFCHSFGAGIFQHLNPGQRLKHVTQPCKVQHNQLKNPLGQLGIPVQHQVK